MMSTLACPAPAATLQRQSRLWQNAGWNLCGTVLPMTVGVFVIPRLIERLGAGRFGILTIAWALVGYLSLFDFGMGRSLTKLIAEQLGSGNITEVPKLWSGSIVLITVQGMVGGILLAGLAPWLSSTALKMPPALQHDARLSLYLVSLIVPIVTSSACLRGFLEAYCAFPALNAVKICLGVSGFVGPLLAMQASRTAWAAILTILAGRLLAWFGYFFLCLRITGHPFRFYLLSRREFAMILRLGGWMTVSNLVSPLMNSLDTFLIGALISVSQVQYYSVPAEVVTKGLLLSSSLAAVLFPVFSSLALVDRRQTQRIYSRSLATLTVWLLAFVLLCGVLAKPGLSLWLGPDFAQHSYRVAQVIAVGVFANGLASVPFALIQASGRPDITAKIHLLELPLYAVAVYVLTTRLGVLGTAVAWTARTALDTLLLLKYSPLRPFENSEALR
jgi:O-antigen/teichoic acid export membrane protein